MHTGVLVYFCPFHNDDTIVGSDTDNSARKVNFLEKKPANEDESKACSRSLSLGAALVMKKIVNAGMTPSFRRRNFEEQQSDIVRPPFPHCLPNNPSMTMTIAIIALVAPPTQNVLMY